MAATVHVKNIAAQTGEKEVRDFFSFCGKISSLELQTASDSTKTASVTFEKETAAKTALLLDNTQLGSSQVQVSSASTGSSPPASSTSPTADHTDDELAQEDKPRSRIIAEYLAQGYVISDGVIEKAISLDNQHGVSSRFTNALKNYDQKFKASERAQELDQQYQVSQRAQGIWTGLTSYFEKALETATGQKLRAFYEQGNKQVLDVHNEARHLADLKSGKATDIHPVPGSTNRTQCSCSADQGRCPCKPGQCACASCGKNPDENPAGVGGNAYRLTAAAA